MARNETVCVQVYTASFGMGAEIEDRIVFTSAYESEKNVVKRKNSCIGFTKKVVCFHFHEKFIIAEQLSCSNVATL